MRERNLLNDSNDLRIFVRNNYSCSKCGAKPGKHCMGVNQLRKQNHRERYSHVKS